MSRLLYCLCGEDRDLRFSPHVWKVIMALHHKELDFEEVPVRFTEIPRIEGGASKTVPVLNDNGRIVSDSFEIARYLDTAYPDRPSLFGGGAGMSLSKFVESWSQTQLHTAITMIAIKAIYDLLDPASQAYFRPAREARIGMTLEEAEAGREAAILQFRQRLEPLRALVRAQSFIGGDRPLFADYIPFGALQWLRVTVGLSMIDESDPVLEWFNRVGSLYGSAALKAKSAG